VQFTPDLLPSDITGIEIYNPKTNEFEIKKANQKELIIALF